MRVWDRPVGAGAGLGYPLSGRPPGPGDFATGGLAGWPTRPCPWRAQHERHRHARLRWFAALLRSAHVLHLLPPNPQALEVVRLAAENAALSLAPNDDLVYSNKWLRLLVAQEGEQCTEEHARHLYRPSVPKAGHYRGAAGTVCCSVQALVVCVRRTALTKDCLMQTHVLHVCMNDDHHQTFFLSPADPRDGRDRMLQALAICDRLKRCLADVGAAAMGLVQPPADQLAERLGIRKVGGGWGWECGLGLERGRPQWGWCSRPQSSWRNGWAYGRWGGVGLAGGLAGGLAVTSCGVHLAGRLGMQAVGRALASAHTLRARPAAPARDTPRC